MKIIISIILVNLFISCNNAQQETNNNVSKEVKLDISKNDETLQDIDGNEYNTIKINGRIWMASNLKVTKFSNGDPIPNLLKDSQWKNTNGPAYSLFDNSMKNFDFGCLYNLNAVIDKRNICPKGWHIPTQDETISKDNFNPEEIINHNLFNNKKLGWRRVYDDNDQNDEYNTFFREIDFNDGGSSIYWLGDSYMDDNYSTDDPNDKIIRGRAISSGELGEYNWGNKYDGFPCRCIKDSTSN